jgi:hypothetical protein
MVLFLRNIYSWVIVTACTKIAFEYWTYLREFEVEFNMALDHKKRPNEYCLMKKPENLKSRGMSLFKIRVCILHYMHILELLDN